jgi:hypothetical protein
LAVAARLIVLLLLVATRAPESHSQQPASDAAAAFARIRALFLQQCTDAAGFQSFREQIRCTHSLYVRAHGTTSSLRLFDGLASRYLSTASISPATVRAEFAGLLERVHRALLAGVSAEEPVDDILEAATPQRAPQGTARHRQ